jgi:anion-transporting  ArsA/GET3 family ATPase
VPRVPDAPPAPEPPIEERRLLFVLGKGGAGKSTVAAALGLDAVARGHRTLLVEVASQHQMARLFEVAPADDRDRDTEAELAPGLWTLSIDPQHATEEYLAGQLKLRPVVEMLTRSKAFTHFTSAAPGLAELVTLGKIWSVAVALTPDGSAPVWDRVIVDSPATGHGLALLETARNVEELAGDGPIKSQAGRIEAVVSHPAATGIVLVARPEELSVTEALEAADTLHRRRLPVAAALLNGMRPRRFADGEEDLLGRLSGASDRRLRTASALALEHLHATRSEEAYRERLEQDGGVPVRALPLLVRRRMGAAVLRELAGHLSGPAA